MRPHPTGAEPICKVGSLRSALLRGQASRFGASCTRRVCGVWLAELSPACRVVFTTVFALSPG